jgi:hypothetical protein
MAARRILASKGRGNPLARKLEDFGSHERTRQSRPVQRRLSRGTHRSVRADALAGAFFHFHSLHDRAERCPFGFGQRTALCPDLIGGWFPVAPRPGCLIGLQAGGFYVVAGPCAWPTAPGGLMVGRVSAQRTDVAGGDFGLREAVMVWVLSRSVRRRSVRSNASR